MGERICVIEGCGRPHCARGYCDSHYARLRKYGDPRDVRRVAMSTEDRFWSKVDTSGDCWEWIAGKCSGGYGNFLVDGRQVGAHRWAYENRVGPIPQGLHLDHLCRNRKCVNPDHLEPVTQQENSRRGLAGEPQRSRTHCRKGHPYDEVNTIVLRGGRKRACKACSNAACLRCYYARKAREAT